MSVNLDEYSIDRITKRGVAEIIVEEEFVSLIKTKNNLRLKTVSYTHLRAHET